MKASSVIGGVLFLATLCTGCGDDEDALPFLPEEQVTTCEEACQAIDQACGTAEDDCAEQCDVDLEQCPTAEHAAFDDDDCGRADPF